MSERTINISNAPYFENKTWWIEIIIVFNWLIKNPFDSIVTVIESVLYIMLLTMLNL